MSPSMDRHADNTFYEVFYTCIYRTSNVDKLLKMPSDSISEGVIFQNFLGAPDPLVLACFACLCASHTMSINMLVSPTSTMMTGLVVPPPLSKV